MNTRKLLKKWKKRWHSAIVPKKRISEFTGGLLKPQTLTNLTSNGNGPTPFYIRGRAVYDIDELLKWLAGYMTATYDGYKISNRTSKKRAGLGAK